MSLPRPVAWARQRSLSGGGRCGGAELEEGLLRPKDSCEGRNKAHDGRMGSWAVGWVAGGEW